MGCLKILWGSYHYMSICQRKVTDIIFVMGSGGELNEMSSVVLYSWETLIFSWFLWHRDLCFRCSTSLLHGESYGVGWAWGNNGSFGGSFHILLEWCCFCVWDGEWPGVNSYTSGFSINLTDHPHLLFPCYPSTPALRTFLPCSIPPSLASSCRSLPLSCKHTYTHILTHVLPPWNQRSIFSAAFT